MDRLNNLALLICLMVVATTLDAKPASLVSKKQRVTIVVDSPRTWKGPGYKAWPSYEIWSFSKGMYPAASFIEIRIDPVRGPKLDSNAATTEQITKTFDDFTNPIVESIAKEMVGKTPVMVWAVHNVDGELLIADLRLGDSDFHFSLRTNSSQEHRRYTKTFLDVMKSIQIFPKRIGVSLKF